MLSGHASYRKKNKSTTWNFNIQSNPKVLWLTVTFKRTPGPSLFFLFFPPSEWKLFPAHPQTRAGHTSCLCEAARWNFIRIALLLQHSAVESEINSGEASDPDCSRLTSAESPQLSLMNQAVRVDSESSEASRRVDKASIGGPTLQRTRARETDVWPLCFYWSRLQWYGGKEDKCNKKLLRNSILINEDVKLNNNICAIWLKSFISD